MSDPNVRMWPRRCAAVSIIFHFRVAFLIGKRAIDEKLITVSIYAGGHMEIEE
jgi:hypothetical protein